MTLSSSSSDSDSIRDLQIKAQKAFSAGDYVSALRLFVEWSNSTPENHKARERIAETLHCLGRTDQAIAVYKKVAEDYMAAGGLIKSIAIHKTILSLDPEDEEIKEHLLKIFGSKVPEELASVVRKPAAKPGKAPPPQPPTEGKKKVSEEVSAEDLGLDSLGDLEKPKGPPSMPPPVAEKMDELNTVFSEILGEDTELVDFGRENASSNPQDMFQRTPLFSDLQPDELAILIDRLNLKNYQGGETICEEGDTSHIMWMIVQGQVDIQTHKSDGSSLHLATLGEGDFFGEGGFVTHSPRSASAIAKGDLAALEITKKDFDSAIEAHPRMKEVLETFYHNRMADRVMAQSVLFGILPSFRRAELMQSFDVKSFKGGEIILKEGDTEGNFFLIKTGQVEIVVDQNSQEKILETLGPADFFGEVNILADSPVPFRARAKGDTELLGLRKIEVEGIMQMFPEAETILKERAQKRSKKIKKLTK